MGIVLLTSQYSWDSTCKERERNCSYSIIPSPQLLERLNLMDYSLLVGIHDCTAPPSPEDAEAEEWEEEEEWDEGNGYISNDDIGDLPHSPQSPGTGLSGQWSYNVEIQCTKQSYRHSDSTPEAVIFYCLLLYQWSYNVNITVQYRRTGSTPEAVIFIASYYTWLPLLI